MPKDHWKSLSYKSKISRENHKRYNNRDPSWTKRDIKETICWFGKYKGTKFKDIPLEYLAWFVDNSTNKFPFIIQLRNYLEDTIEELEKKLPETTIKL